MRERGRWASFSLKGEHLQPVRQPPADVTVDLGHGGNLTSQCQRRIKFLVSPRPDLMATGWFSNRVLV